MSNDHTNEDFNFLKCIRLKGTGIKTQADLDDFVLKVLNMESHTHYISKFEDEMDQKNHFFSSFQYAGKILVEGRSANFQSLIIHDCLEIDRLWDELVDVEMVLIEMKMKELKAELEDLSPEELQRQLSSTTDAKQQERIKQDYENNQKLNQTLKNLTRSEEYKKLFTKHGKLIEDIKLCKINLSGTPEILASEYSLVIFKSFKLAHRFTFMMQNKEKLKELGVQDPDSIEVSYAPDPFDIDWNEYAKPYEKTRTLKWVGMAILCFLILPSFTFMMEYSVPLKIATWFFYIEGKTKTPAEILVENLSFFFLVRLAISSIYSALASYYINGWFRNRPYKTYLERDRENFTFYNIYFLINMIVSDFYGIIIIGIQGMG